MLAPPPQCAHMQAYTYMHVFVWWWYRSGEPHRGALTCDAEDCRPFLGPSRALRRRQLRPVVTGQPHVPCCHTTSRAHPYTSWPKRPRHPSGRREGCHRATARGRAPHARGPERRHRARGVSRPTSASCAWRAVPHRSRPPDIIKPHCTRRFGSMTAGGSTVAGEYTSPRRRLDERRVLSQPIAGQHSVLGSSDSRRSPPVQ